jgi:hypothetical protein
MIANTGIVDMRVAVGEHKNHQGRIDYAPGDLCPQLSGAVCFQPVGVTFIRQLIAY